jgi:hypothetical protein
MFPRHNSAKQWSEGSVLEKDIGSMRGGSTRLPKQAQIQLPLVVRLRGKRHWRWGRICWGETLGGIGHRSSHGSSKWARPGIGGVGTWACSVGELPRASEHSRSGIRGHDRRWIATAQRRWRKSAGQRHRWWWGWRTNRGWWRRWWAAHRCRWWWWGKANWGRGWWCAAGVEAGCRVCRGRESRGLGLEVHG